MCVALATQSTMSGLAILVEQASANNSRGWRALVSLFSFVCVCVLDARLCDAHRRRDKFSRASPPSTWSLVIDDARVGLDDLKVRCLATLLSDDDESSF